MSYFVFYFNLFFCFVHYKKYIVNWRVYVSSMISSFQFFGMKQVFTLRERTIAPCCSLFQTVQWRFIWYTRVVKLDEPLMNAHYYEAFIDGYYSWLFIFCRFYSRHANAKKKTKQTRCEKTQRKYIKMSKAWGNFVRENNWQQMETKEEKGITSNWIITTDWTSKLNALRNKYLNDIHVNFQNNHWNIFNFISLWLIIFDLVKMIWSDIFHSRKKHFIICCCCVSLLMWWI